jgi:ACS family hexuronate transporter-like MFS transporter
MGRNFVVLLGGQIFLCFGGFAIPPLIPFFQPELGLSYSQVGSIMTFMYLGAILMSLPAGWLTDHLGIKRTIVYAQWGTGGFVALLALSQSYAALISFAFLVGLGYGVSNPPTTKGIMFLVQEGNRGLAMSLKQTGVPIAGALAAAILPPLALLHSWRFSFFFAGITVSIVGLLSQILYQTRRESALPREDRWEEDWGRDWKKIARNREILLLSIAGAFCALVQTSLFTYTVLYLMEARKFELLQATFSLTLMSVGGIVGRILWGAVSDRIFKGSRRIVLQILVAVIFAMALLLGSNVTLPSILLVSVFFILGMSAIGWNGVFHAYIGEISPKGFVGLATGVSMAIVFMGGLIGPFLFGKIVDTFQSYPAAWFFLSWAMAMAFIFYRRVPERKTA